MTLDATRIGEQVDGLIAEVATGRARSLAIVIPAPMPWPLPAYELALMIAAHARADGTDVRVDLITPEAAPLALFGSEASRAVAAELQELGVTVTTGVQCAVSDPGTVFIHPGPRVVRADRVVALPQLFGPPSPGIPGDAHNGFLTVDAHCRMRGISRVFAAGDATDYPIKHGSIAAQQADTAARSIASLAGAAVEPLRFDPVLSGVLAGGETSLRLHAHASGNSGVGSHVAQEATQPGPTAQLAATYLTPYLDAHAGVAAAA